MSQNNHFDEVILNEEYKIWRKNIPYLYNMVYTQSLKWPSLTVDFLSDVSRPINSDSSSTMMDDENDNGNWFSLHRLLLSTHTDGHDSNYLHIATVKLPDRHMRRFDSSTFDHQTGEHVIHDSKNCANFKLDITINHGNYEVNRAKSMPQNPCVLATRSTQADVLIFDYTKHPSKTISSEVNPQMTLKGHSEEGNGISWSTVKPGWLTSCGEDGKVCMWDAGSGKANALWSSSSTEKSVVNDVTWHCLDSDILLSGDANGCLGLWDIRANNSGGSLIKKSVANCEINCVAMNYICWQAFLVGCEDGQNALYDLRSMHQPVCRYSLGYREGIEQLSWCLHDEAIFASSSSNRIHIYDIRKEQKTYTVNDSSISSSINTITANGEMDSCPKSELPSELAFVHAGHVGHVYDFCWNRNERGIIASVSADNALNIWQPAIF